MRRASELTERGAKLVREEERGSRSVGDPPRGDGLDVARCLRRELDPVSFHLQRLRRRSRTVLEGIVCPARNCSSDRAIAACKRSRSTSSSASPSSSSRLRSRRSTNSARSSAGSFSASETIFSASGATSGVYVRDTGLGKSDFVLARQGQEDERGLGDLYRIRYV